MNRAEIIAALQPIIITYAPESELVANINEDSDFIKDLKINSANLVDIVLDVEEQFDIEIDNQSMEQMLTVKAAVDVISEKLATK